MDQNKINMFLATNAKFFTAAQLADLRNRITELDDSLLMYTSQLKDPTTALILSIFTGGLGIDRFYIGDTGLGIGKLLTGGGCGIWSLIDWFLIMDDTRNKILSSSSSLSFGFGAISPDSPGASPAYSTSSPVSPVRPAARNVPFSPSCTDTPSRPGTTTIFCPSLSSSSSHSHFFPAARAHFIVRSPHRPH